MDKLPTEILTNIFLNLHFCEKQECMLVCRSWSNVIRSIALLDTVHITQDNTLARLRSLLVSQPSKKAQIKNLVIDFAKVKDEALGSCPEYFPKVRCIYLRDDANRFHGQHTRREISLMSWIAKTEVLEQYNFTFDNCLLDMGVYSTLKTLVIKAIGLISRLNVDILANTPNLTSLTLGTTLISINHLEKIHANLLFLKSMELDIYLGPSDVHKTIIPELVTPSDTVKTLLINILDGHPNRKTETILKFLRYMRYKYTNLKEFRFLMGHGSNPNEEMIFTNGMLPLIEHIGSKAKLLEIDCSNMLPPLFALMNSSGFQAQCLKLSSTCSHQKRFDPLILDQHSFVRELTINLNSARWIPDFSSLMKSIKVLNKKGMKNFEYNGQHTICLQQILGYCSDSLNSLRIEKFHVDGSGSLSQSYALNKLQIYTRYISLSVYKFISQCLPHLRYLVLGSLGKTSGDIKLHSLSLYRLDLHLPPRTYVKITTNVDNRIRYFFTPKPSAASVNWKASNNRLVCDMLRQITHEKAREHSEEMICVELNSVQLLQINNMLTR